MGRKTTAFIDFQTNSKLSEPHPTKNVEEWIELTDMGIFFDRFYDDKRKIPITDLIFPDRETKALFKMAFNVS